MGRIHGSSGYGDTCYNFSRYSSYDLADYACQAVFLAVCLGLMVTLCVVRRKTGAGKRLIGLPYMFAVFFAFLDFACGIIGSTLQVCDVISVTNFYEWQIAGAIFYGIHTFLLLFVFVWTLNDMLRKQLGHNPSALKIALGVDLFILGGLLASYVGMNCYESYWTPRSHYEGDYDWMASSYVNLAFWVIYLPNILASGALSLLAVRSLQKKHVAGSSLTFSVSLLFLSLFVRSLISVITNSAFANGHTYFSDASYAAMAWISTIFHTLALSAVILIAKDAVWRSNTFAATDVPVEQQYDTYNYQQAPIYDGAGNRV